MPNYEIPEAEELHPEPQEKVKKRERRQRAFAIALVPLAAALIFGAIVFEYGVTQATPTTTATPTASANSSNVWSRDTVSVSAGNLATPSPTDLTKSSTGHAEVGSWEAPSSSLSNSTHGSAKVGNWSGPATTHRSHKA